MDNLNLRLGKPRRIHCTVGYLNGLDEFEELPVVQFPQPLGSIHHKISVELSFADMEVIPDFGIECQEILELLFVHNLVGVFQGVEDGHQNELLVY